ncbi:MAG: ATP-binding cassette domain-containing protein [Gammaproteobacteria bacterium]|nr:ATP-binding cassette domain-containing protein [Gammaproteobacteria bacterium]MDH5594792.1 ATP-binding cassette domain-containing protein [Gammaproteobacteria bacterium]
MPETNHLLIKQLKTALFGPVDLSVNEGECVCLSGVSGSGKTLLLRSIADLDPHEGDVMLGNETCSAMDAHEWRRQVGLLSSESQWWFEQVGQHFKQPTSDWFEKLGFNNEVMHWQVSRLSSGEKQRLALARLLENNPKVLLLDEPTANLDKENTALVENLVRCLTEKNNTTVLWVSHDADQIKRVASRHFRFSQGGLEEAAI